MASYYRPSWLTAICWFLLCSGTCMLDTAQALRHPHSNLPYFPTTGFGHNVKTFLKLRGGSARPAAADSGPIELNPGYKHFATSSRNEHEAWLQQQQQAQHQRQQSGFTFGNNMIQKETSVIERIQNYFVSLHQISPSLFWTTIACMAVFGMWHTPRFTRWPDSVLYRYFVNNHDNVKKTFGLSLVLPSLSHISPYHLLVNLMSLSHLGPSVRQLLLQSQSLGFFGPSSYRQGKSQMWPLILSSAAFSNALFLILQPQSGGRGASSSSSLGLSGVTMALLAIQARASPNHKYGIVLGVIPVSLQAQHLLQILLVTSLVGTFFSSSSSSSSLFGRRQGSQPIAHGAHFGGLLYGILYYELVILGLTPRQLFRKISKSLIGR